VFAPKGFGEVAVGEYIHSGGIRGFEGVGGEDALIELEAEEHLSLYEESEAFFSEDMQRGVQIECVSGATSLEAEPSQVPRVLSDDVVGGPFYMRGRLWVLEQEGACAYGQIKLFMSINSDAVSAFYAFEALSIARGEEQGSAPSSVHVEEGAFVLADVGDGFQVIDASYFCGAGDAHDSDDEVSCFFYFREGLFEGVQTELAVLVGGEAEDVVCSESEEVSGFFDGIMHEVAAEDEGFLGWVFSKGVGEAFFLNAFKIFFGFKEEVSCAPEGHEVGESTSCRHHSEGALRGEELLFIEFFWPAEKQLVQAPDGMFFQEGKNF